MASSRLAPATMSENWPKAELLLLIDLSVKQDPLEHRCSLKCAVQTSLSDFVSLSM